MTDRPAIRLTGLTKVSGTVRGGSRRSRSPRQFFSMLGPSGSGKTTVLRLIAGFDTHRRYGRTFGRMSRKGAVRAGREHRLPGLCAVPAHDRAGQRRLRPEGARDGKRAERHEPREALESVRLGGSGTAGRPSCPAASGSGSRWPGQPWCGPRRCCWMSRWGLSTSSSANRCRSNSRSCSATWASRSSSSPTIRKRP